MREEMRRIITEMQEDGGPILVYEVNPVTGLIASRMSAKEFTSKEKAKESHAKLIDHWPKKLSSEEIKKMVKTAESGISETKFGKRTEKAIAGVD